MNPFEMVIAIVLIVTIGRILQARHRSLRGEGLDAETAALQAEIRALKERIQVLERIATDNNRAVALDAEIERLRDPAAP